MKNYKTISALALGMGIALSGTAMADVQEECIVTAKVARDGAMPNTIQLRFTQLDHGDQARCRAKGRRGGLGRLQFAMPAGDTLAQLDHGTEVHYRYQMRHGEAHWYRLDSTELQVTRNR